MAANPISPSISVNALIQYRSNAALPLVFDVRRDAAFAADPRLIAGSVRLAPAQIPAHLGGLRSSGLSGHQLVMVCVHGHAVSQTAALIARCHGFKASYLEGGFEAWLARGLPILQAGGSIGLLEVRS